MAVGTVAGWNGFAPLLEAARAAQAESKGSIAAVVLDGIAEVLKLELGGAMWPVWCTAEAPPTGHEGTRCGWNCGLTDAAKGVVPTAETVAAG